MVTIKLVDIIMEYFDLSPPYHVVYDEKFSTVTTTRLQIDALNVDSGTFTLNDWNDLITCGYDRHPALVEAMENGKLLPVLGEEWMSPAEVAEARALQEIITEETFGSRRGHRRSTSFSPYPQGSSATKQSSSTSPATRRSG
jgi:hypothetical protein